MCVEAPVKLSTSRESRKNNKVGGGGGGHKFDIESLSLCENVTMMLCVVY